MTVPGDSKPQREEPPHWDDYRAGTMITTRWNDNDVYAHVNNAIYYLFFDTAVNQYLVEQKVLNIKESSVIGLVVKTDCAYFAPIEFPDVVQARIRVDHLGKSSVRYAVGLFRNDEKTASAAGHFTHVYVDRDTRRPVALPDDLRRALDHIVRA